MQIAKRRVVDFHRHKPGTVRLLDETDPEALDLGFAYAPLMLFVGIGVAKFALNSMQFSASMPVG